MAAMDFEAESVDANDQVPYSTQYDPLKLRMKKDYQ